jgi:hypothetical protein
MENLTTTETMKSRRIQKGFYFGVYKGIKWSIESEKDGNKYWWYMTLDGDKFCMPATSKKKSIWGVKVSIDFIAEERDSKIIKELTKQN